jgi:hypothetical protein
MLSDFFGKLNILLLFKRLILNLLQIDMPIDLIDFSLQVSFRVLHIFDL